MSGRKYSTGPQGDKDLVAQCNFGVHSGMKVHPYTTFMWLSFDGITTYLHELLTLLWPVKILHIDIHNIIY